MKYVFLALLLCIPACGTPEYTPPDMGEVDDQSCQATVIDDITPYASGQKEVGTSVELGSIGTSPTSLDAMRTLVAGAPEGSYPRVRVEEVSKSTGELQASGRTQDLIEPMSGDRAFGKAVLSRDIKVRWDTGGSGQGPWRACGEELLVGAPSNESYTSGYVAVYEPLVNTSGSLYVHASTLTPHNSGLEAFGTAIAAPDPRENASSPWNRGGSYAVWIAISSPDVCTVEVYTVNPSSSPPYTYWNKLTKTGSCPGTLWGQSLVAGDFDGDTYFDLAVGAPGDGTGKVTVFKGSTSASAPLDTTGFTFSTTSFSSYVDEYGFSLAAGRFHADYDDGDADDRDILAIGAPGSFKTTGGGVYDLGALCEARLEDDGSGSFDIDEEGCFHNNITGWAGGDRFGEAVAVGNLSNVDSAGAETDAARVREVAVGLPGYDSGEGLVAVYLTGNDSIRESDLATEIESTLGSGGHFGGALASGFGKENYWQDLVIGAPEDSSDDGAAALTRAIDVYGCTGAVGIWEADDLDSNAVDVQIAELGDGSMRVTFLEDYASRLHDSSNTTCDVDGEDMVFDIPASTSFILDPAWDCTSGSPQDWSDVDATSVINAILEANGIDPSAGSALTALMDVEMSLSGSGTTLDIDFDFSPMPWFTLNAVLAVVTGDTMDTTCTMESMSMTLVDANICE